MVYSGDYSGYYSGDYSGYYLVYGLSFSDTHQLMEFFENFCYGTTLNQLVDKLYQDDGENEEDIVNEFLLSEGYNAKVHRKTCCYDDGTWFFGYMLGETNFVYRNNVEEFDSFEQYQTFVQSQLDMIEREWLKLRSIIQKEFNSIKKLYKASNDNGDNDNVWTDPSFYKYSNDCEYC